MFPHYYRVLKNVPVRVLGTMFTKCNFMLRTWSPGAIQGFVLKHPDCEQRKGKPNIVLH
jgi:hypothetical protein